MEEFPWHSEASDALDLIRRQARAEEETQDLSPSERMKLSDSFVRQFFCSLVEADDLVLKNFLHEKKRRAVTQLNEAQKRCLSLLSHVILLPTKYPHLPQVMDTVKFWYELSLHSPTSNTRRNPIPIWTFDTKLGKGCITCTQLMLMAEGVFKTSVRVFDWVDIDIKHTPKSTLTKITILENGTKIAGFNPVKTDAKTLVRICRTLKSLQEADPT